jgi:ADP-ribose pyrophosphatase
MNSHGGSNCRAEAVTDKIAFNLQVLDCTPTMVSDPGLTTANMQVCTLQNSVIFPGGTDTDGLKMVTVEVTLNEGDAEPEQHLDDGEFIERVVVPLSELYEKLQGE